MNNDFDKSLQDLLRNHTEQPSLDCWDKISSHLDAVQAIDASSAATANTASPFSQFVGSVVGKIAITATIATCVGLAVYFAVEENEEPKQTVQQQEMVETVQDAVYEEYIAEAVAENKRETVLPSDKIVPTNNLTATDTAIEKRIEENTTLFFPMVSSPDNQSLKATDGEFSPQSKEKAQPQKPSQSIEKESVSEVVKEKEKEKKQEPVAEEKEAPKEHIPPHIGIPNIFTPNGDGKNDYFVFTNLELIGENQLDIYTRNGKVVYSKHFYDNSWDGRGLPDGTYYYIFRFVYEGNQFMRKGTITIRR